MAVHNPVTSHGLSSDGVMRPLAVDADGRLLTDAGGSGCEIAPPLEFTYSTASATTAQEFFIPATSGFRYGVIVIEINSAAALTAGVTITPTLANGALLSPLVGYTLPLAAGATGDVALRRTLGAISNIGAAGANSNAIFAYYFTDEQTRIDAQDLRVTYTKSNSADVIIVRGILRAY